MWKAIPIVIPLRTLPLVYTGSIEWACGNQGRRVAQSGTGWIKISLARGRVTLVTIAGSTGMMFAAHPLSFE